MVESLLRVEELQIQFRTIHGIIRAVNNASFDINRAEVYGLVGESGCGKSATALSILRLLASNAKIVSGRILFKGRNLLELSYDEIRTIRGKEISLVFQDPQTSLDPVFTISDQIAEAIEIHQKLQKNIVNENVVSLLKGVGIPQPEIRKDQYPHQFSGGMKQRAMSAMALSNRPDLIIADEPTTSLDVTIQAQIIDLLRDLKNDFGVAILLITHDMGLIAELCNRVSVIYAGYVVETADVYSIFKNPMHPYTRGLIESIPRVDVDSEELASIPGRVASPLELHKVCAFYPRCKYVKDICSRGIPELLEIKEGIKVACWLAQEGKI